MRVYHVKFGLHIEQNLKKKFWKNCGKAFTLFLEILK